MRSWLAIDPGASGSLCRLYEDGTTYFIDFKSNGLKGYIDYLQSILNANQRIELVAIEKVASMPGQGVKSVFSFGQRLGELEGMLQTLQLGYELVPPKTWQKACGIVMPKRSTALQRKQQTYQTISKLYPQADVTGPKGGLLDGRCDSLGMAHYLRKTYN
jgi:hypothetical protein